MNLHDDQTIDFFEMSDAEKAALGLPDGYFDRFSSLVFEKIEAEKANDELPDFLKKPSLRSLPFRTPKGYFEGLEALTFEKIEAEKADDELPDFLKKANLKNLPFRMPDGYFEGLSSQVFEKIEAAEKGRIVRLFEPFRAVAGLRAISAMAAALALLVAAVWFLRPAQPPVAPVLAAENAACETSKCLAETVTDDEAQAFLAANLDDLEAEDLAEAAALSSSAPTKKAKKKALDGLEISPEDAQLLIDELDAEDLEEML